MKITILVAFLLFSQALTEIDKIREDFTKLKIHHGYIKILDKFFDRLSRAHPRPHTSKFYIIKIVHTTLKLIYS